MLFEAVKFWEKLAKVVRLIMFSLFPPIKFISIFEEFFRMNSVREVRCHFIYQMKFVSKHSINKKNMKNEKKMKNIFKGCLAKISIVFRYITAVFY